MRVVVCLLKCQNSQVPDGRASDVGVMYYTLSVVTLNSHIEYALLNALKYLTFILLPAGTSAVLATIINRCERQDHRTLNERTRIIHDVP
jgi:hypothetical protein